MNDQIGKKTIQKIKRRKKRPIIKDQIEKNKCKSPKKKEKKILGCMASGLPLIFLEKK